MDQPEPIPEELRDAFMDTMKHTASVHRVAVILQSRFCASNESALKAADMIVDMVREAYER